MQLTGNTQYHASKKAAFPYTTAAIRISVFAKRAVVFSTDATPSAFNARAMAVGPDLLGRHRDDARSGKTACGKEAVSCFVSSTQLMS